MAEQAEALVRNECAAASERFEKRVVDAQPPSVRFPSIVHGRQRWVLFSPILLKCETNTSSTGTVESPHASLSPS